MCNKYRTRMNWAKIRDAFAQRQLPLTFPEGTPNTPPEVAITDRAPIVRAAAGGGFEVVSRPWGYRNPKTGAPVPVWVSEGRQLGQGRCLALTDGYYEFTPQHGRMPKGQKKQRWVFTLPGEEWFFLAGIEAQESFVILSAEPGPDTVPIHDRQMTPLHFDQGVAWLGGAPAAGLIGPLPAGSLMVAPD